MTIDQRLADLGVTLPTPPKPGGAYSSTETAGNLLFIAAQFPIEGGEPRYVGKIGAELDIDAGRAAARLAAINVLAQIRAALGGFERLKSIVRLEGHLNTAPDFTQHAKVLDGASELFHEALGDRAGHVRSLYGHATLPLNLAIELVVIAEVTQ